MPPKRKQATDDGPPPKKAKLEVKQNESIFDDNSPSSSSGEERRKKPLCQYDGACYRINEQHWRETRHVKQKGPVKKGANTTADTQKPSLSSGKTAIAYASSSDEDDTPKKKPLTKVIDYSSDSFDDDGDSSSSSSSYHVKGKGKGKAKATAKPAVKPKAKTKPVIKKTHPKPPLTKKPSVSKLFDGAPTDTVIRPGLEAYKGILETALMGHKISIDEKRLLQKVRARENITKEEHNQLLGQYGWTEDEYELGEREEKEKEILAKENGFSIILLKKGQKMTPEEDTVWAKACAKFYQTMAKAQGNYEIASLGIIVNTRLKNQFEKQRKEFEKTSPKRGYAEWGFHGSSPESIKAIAKEGFKHPDDLKKKKVETLDEGYFGKGIYFSMYSDYAMWYSEERESDQILLCSLLPGNLYQCTERMDGKGLQKGYDSHFSPKGNEIIIFAPDQILPRYIITFIAKEGEEREQED